MTRNTADYQRADSAHYIHPFTDSKALGTGARIIQRAEGVYLWDSDGQQNFGRHVGFVVRQHRLRSPRTG